MIVLDTNIVSEGDKPSPDSHVLDWFARQDLLSLFLCGPVLMELSCGAETFFSRTGSERYLRTLRKVAERYRGRILEFDGDIPAITGKLRVQRDEVGRPISIPNAMIAAICLFHGATLATRNIRDFDGLDLKLVNPFEKAA
jgi:predicted nucleic acid-binding protein